MAPEKAFKEPSQEYDESRIASTAQDAPDDHSGSVEEEYDEARIDSHIRRDLHLQQDSHDLKTSGEQQGGAGRVCRSPDPCGNTADFAGQGLLRASRIVVWGG